MYFSGYDQVLIKCKSLLNKSGIIILADDKVRTIEKKENVPGWYDIDKLTQHVELEIFYDTIVNNYYRTIFLQDSNNFIKDI